MKMDLTSEMPQQPAPRSVIEFAFGGNPLPQVKKVDAVERENTPKTVPSGDSRSEAVSGAGESGRDLFGRFR
jgi:hypothetical protein